MRWRLPLKTRALHTRADYINGVELIKETYLQYKWHKCPCVYVLASPFPFHSSLRGASSPLALVNGGGSSEHIVDPLILDLSELHQYCCILCFLSVLPSLQLVILTFTIPALQLSFQPCSLSPAVAPTSLRQLLEIHPISFPSSGQNRKCAGSKKRGAAGVVWP